MSKPRIGVLLSGCGVYDGSEIHEAVLTLLALERAGATAVCMAPDVPQLHVVDHVTGKAQPGESRNVLVESARIARGSILALGAVNARDIDALLLPGGFGAAKNLSDFAVAGAGCQVEPSVAAFVREVHSAGKWVGALCIAPVVLAKLFGDERPRVTIGTDSETASAVEKMGARHVACTPHDFVVDEEQRLLTTPAYMLAKSIGEAASGIEALVKELVARVRSGVLVRV